jgi:hypothetical protein
MTFSWCNLFRILISRIAVIGNCNDIIYRTIQRRNSSQNQIKILVHRIAQMNQMFENAAAAMIQQDTSQMKYSTVANSNLITFTAMT